MSRGSSLYFRTRSPWTKSHTRVRGTSHDRSQNTSKVLTQWMRSPVWFHWCTMQERCIATAISAAKHCTWAMANKHGVIPRISTATGMVEHVLYFTACIHRKRETSSFKRRCNCTFSRCQDCPIPVQHLTLLYYFLEKRRFFFLRLSISEKLFNIIRILYKKCVIYNVRCARILTIDSDD